MNKDIPKNQNGVERLKQIRQNGVSIMICDFSNCSRDEGVEILKLLVTNITNEAPASVRLLIDTTQSPHDASQANQWKRHLELFDSRLKKSAIVGLGPLNRIALAGLRMYARLMGHEKSASQVQVFDGREAALEYLASEK